MDFALREELAKKLKKSFRVISPYKVEIGWIDLAIFGKESVGIDFCLNYDSSIERLNSFPFRKRIIIGDCEGCTDLWEFCKKYEITLNEVEHFESSLKTKRLEDNLAYLYITQEALDDGRFEELKNFGFATSYSRLKVEPKFFVSLTNEGYRIAKKIIYSRILAKIKKLEKLANPLNYLIALGLSTSLSLKPEDFSTQKDLKSLLYFYRKIPLNNFVIRERHPKVMLAEFLVKSALNEEAVKLAKKLTEMGLATSHYLYSPSGEPIWEEFRFAREVVEYLIKSSFFSIEKEIAEKVRFLLHAIQGRAEISQIYEEQIGLAELKKPSLSTEFEEFLRFKIATFVGKVLNRLDLN